MLTASPYTGDGRFVKRLVAHAVACEPVSVCEFPANREFYREFCKIVASGGPRP